MLVDLHIHSTFSDGFFTPQEILESAIAKQIKVLSITDHDSIDGYLVGKNYLETIEEGLKLLCGVELGTQAGENSVHVLGYHIDTTFEPILAKMYELRHAREARLEQILAKVRALGFDVEVEATDVKHRAFGRPHVAQALVEKGYFVDIQQAFDVLLRQGKPGYVPQPKLSPQEAVDLIHRAGGIACLAHPSELANPKLIKHLICETGFDGIEIWHPSAEHKDRTMWLELAAKYKLLTSGGSDFHGESGRFPHSLGEFPVLYENVKSVVEYK